MDDLNQYAELNLQYLYVVSIHLLDSLFYGDKQTIYCNICLYCLQFILACDMVCPIVPSWFGNKWDKGGYQLVFTSARPDSYPTLQEGQFIQFFKPLGCAGYYPYCHDTLVGIGPPLMAFMVSFSAILRIVVSATHKATAATTRDGCIQGL